MEETEKTQRERLSTLVNETIEAMDARAEELGLNLHRLALTLDTRNDDERYLATVIVHDEEDPQVAAADETLLMLKALEGIAIQKHGYDRVTLAELILGPNVTLDLSPTPPAAKPRPADRRPSRHIGQRKRRHGR